MVINAIIERVGQIQTFENSDFVKMDLICKTDFNTDYPQTICFEVHGAEKCENLMKFNKVGDQVEVSFNLRGRSWTNPEGVEKVFNSLVAWKVFKSSATQEIDPTEEF